MARIARVVVPDLPHHVTQHGNRREPVFFDADDYRRYRRRVATAAQRAGTSVWAYCERRLGRPLAPRKPGPKPRVERDTAQQAQLL